MDKKEVIDLLKYGERINLECKKAESKLPNSIWETYSSFANTDGGTILLGVEENIKEIEYERKFTVTGVNDAHKIITEFWNTINSEKVNCNILVDSNVGTCDIDGKTIIWINVPRANYRQRPVYLNGNPLKSFRRNYQGDYHCTETDVQAMYRDANDSGNDGVLLENYTMDDIDLATLHAYRIKFDLVNPDHIWNGLDDINFLMKLGGFRIDRVSGKGWLTAAGLLMFGKGSSVSERFGNIRMDYIDMTDVTLGRRWSDRLTYDGSWENNLYNFMRQVVPKLVSGLKRPFRLEGITRIDDTPLHTAIREAVINMIIHSDYMINGTLKITKLDDGFIFSNPGSLKLPLHEIYEGGHSIARNPWIQTMFRMIGLGDNIGSGFPTILRVWKNENWRKPNLSQNNKLQTVELELRMISTIPPESLEALNSMFGWVYATLDSESQVILSTAYLEKTITNSQLQTILNKSSLEVGRLLSSLVDRDLLLASNKSQWISYQLNTEFEIPPVQEEVGVDINLPPNFKNKADQLIYNYVCANGFITTSQVMQITGIKSRQGAAVALNRLINRELLQKVKKGKLIIYELAK